MVVRNLIINQLSWSPVAWKFPMQSITSKTGHSYTLMYGADTHIKMQIPGSYGNLQHSGKNSQGKVGSMIVGEFGSFNESGHVHLVFCS